MIKKNIVCLFAAVVLLVSAISVQVPLCMAETRVVDRIVAIVNHDIVTLSELNKQTAPFEKAVRDKKYPDEQERELLYRIRKDAVERLVEKALTDQEVKRYGITVTDRELDASVENFKEYNKVSDEDFRKGLEKEGMTLDAFREETRGRLLRTKLVNAEIKSKIVITEEDIKKYHAKTTGITADGSELKKYHIFHILKSYGQDADQAKTGEARDEMEQILARLKNGEEFPILAKLKSESPTSETGGDLGLFVLDDLSSEIRDAVIKLKPGEFSDIVSTSQGYQVFFLKEIVTEEAKPYSADSSAEIEEKLYNDIIEQKFKSWLDGLKEKSYIRIIN